MNNIKNKEEKFVKKIVIATDFSDKVGARYKTESDFSGEEFFEKHLVPAFEEAKNKNKKVFIDFDNSYGYPSSFISSAFGMLSEKFGKEIISFLEMKTEDNGTIKRRVEEAIEEGYEKI